MNLNFEILLLILHILCRGISCDEGHYESDADIISQYTEYQKEKEPMSTKNDLHPSNGTVLNKTCLCVKYFECNVDSVDVDHSTNHTGITPHPESSAEGHAEVSNVESGDILGIVDIRRNGADGNETAQNGCQHYFDVCCAIQNVKNKTEGTGGGGGGPGGPDEPKLNAKNLTNWVHKECGHRNADGIGFKITGATGGESQFGEFPWTTAIVREEVGDDNVTKNVFICGGSLIHPQVILTAAHCIFQLAQSSKKTQLKVRVGEWDTQTLDEPFPHQDRYVKKVITHEQLYRKGLYNDVALLILESEVKLAPNVDTICLPPLSLDPANFDGTDCFSSGWGKNNFGAEGRYQEIMKKVQLPIVPRKTCESELRKSRLGDRFRLHSSFICAGGGGSNDTCLGDGGSPLTCPMLNSGNYIQLGIVAWGIGCGGQTPGVYVNLRPFVPWILDKLKDFHFDDSFSVIR